VVERRLFLLRHAKSSWKDEGLLDRGTAELIGFIRPRDLE